MYSKTTSPEKFNLSLLRIPLISVLLQQLQFHLELLLHAPCCDTPCTAWHLGARDPNSKNRDLQPFTRQNTNHISWPSPPEKNEVPNQIQLPIPKYEPQCQRPHSIETKRAFGCQELCDFFANARVGTGPRCPGSGRSSLPNGKASQEIQGKWFLLK